MKTPRQRVSHIIRSNQYMTMATTSKTGQPWITPLYFASVGARRFYWYSPKKTKHSQNIAQNPRVAITLFDSREIPERVDAVYIKARARVVKQKELAVAIAIMGKKYCHSKMQLKAFVESRTDFTGSSPLRMYVAVAQYLWVLGPNKKYHDKYVDSRETVIGP